MATKAELFREKTEREAQSRAPKKAARSERKSTTKKPGMSRAREVDPHRTTRLIHAARKAGAVVEDSADRPSRKSSRRSRGKVETVSFNEEGIPSTRRGEGHTKSASPLQRRAVARVRSPEARAQRKVGGAVRGESTQRSANAKGNGGPRGTEARSKRT